jgi:hypothetical protein
LRSAACPLSNMHQHRLSQHRLQQELCHACHPCTMHVALAQTGFVCTLSGPKHHSLLMLHVPSSCSILLPAHQVRTD